MKKEGGKPNDVWVVHHGEIYAVQVDGRTGYVHDHVVSHVASSLKVAKDFIKHSWVAPYSWWMVIQYPVDDFEYEKPPCWVCFSYKGKQLKSPPIDSAIKAYKKERLKDTFLQPIAIHD